MPHPPRGTTISIAVALTIGLVVSLPGFQGTSTPSGFRPLLGPLGPPTDRQVIPLATPTTGLAWTQVFTIGAPPSVVHPRMAYDAADGYVVVWGGEPRTRPYLDTNSTWTFANDTWTNRTGTGAAPFGYGGGASMVYDSTDGTVLLEATNLSFSGERTWAYHAGTWTELFPSHQPTPRWYATMAFDPLLNETVLFGGLGLTPEGGELWLADTWVYSHGDWSQVATGTSSTTAQFSQSMTFDPLTGQVVLVTDALSPPVLGRYDFQTFVFNGTGWVEQAATFPYDAFGGFSTLTFDPAFGGLVGQALNDPELFLENQSTEVFVFSGGTWTTEYVGGYPTALNGMVYDNRSGYGVGFSSEPTLNVSGPAYRPATWILSGTPVGPVPEASIQAAASTVLLGGAVWIGAAFNRTYGFTWYQMATDAPGCPATVNAQWMTCTPQKAGTFWVYFVVLDQAGRFSNVSLNLNVQAPLIPPGLVVPSILAGLGVIAAVGGGVVWWRRARARQREPQPADHGNPPAS
jgi:hypothetical protein